MPKDKIKIIVLVKSVQRFKDQLFLAKKLNENNEFIFSFLFSEDLYDDHSALVRESGFFPFSFRRHPHSYSQTRKTKLKDFVKKTPFFRLASWIKTIAENSTFYQILLSQKIYRQLQIDYAIAAKFCRHIKPDIVLIQSDRQHGFVQPFLKVCKNNNIPILLPYMAYSGNEGPKKLREKNIVYKKRLFSSLYSKHIFRKHPQQLFDGCLFFPPSVTMAFDKFGVLFKNPWTTGNGMLDIVCVDSLHTFSQNKEGGVLDERMYIVGDMAYDPLYVSYKSKFEVKRKVTAKYNLRVQKKIVLIALPQLAEHNILNWDDHWKEIHFLMQSLEKLNQNILISLHPRMDRDMYSFLESKYNCRVLDERLFEVMPVADLFVATFSSTIVWAVLCGVNSVVIDFYGLGYSMYNFLKTVNIVNKRDDLQEVLLTYLDKKLDFLEDWGKLSRNDMFDGKVIKRYRELLFVLAPKNSRRTIITKNGFAKKRVNAE